MVSIPLGFNRVFPITSEPSNTDREFDVSGKVPFGQKSKNWSQKSGLRIKRLAKNRTRKFVQTDFVLFTIKFCKSFLFHGGNLIFKFRRATRRFDELG